MLIFVFFCLASDPPSTIRLTANGSQDFTSTLQQGNKELVLQTVASTPKETSTSRKNSKIKSVLPSLFVVNSSVWGDRYETVGKDVYAVHGTVIDEIPSSLLPALASRKMTPR